MEPADWDGNLLRQVQRPLDPRGLRASGLLVAIDVESWRRSAD